MRELERKYIAQFIDGKEALSEVDAREFLAPLTADLDAEFRERRIAQLERYLRNIERTKAADAEREEAWMAKAREIVVIKERWEALGATWECRHDCGISVTTWKYHGDEILRWWSGTTLDEELTLVRAGDERLSALMKEAL